MTDEIIYKKITRKADKGLEGKVIAKHGKQTQQPKREKDQNTPKQGISEHFAWIFLP